MKEITQCKNRRNIKITDKKSDDELYAVLKDAIKLIVSNCKAKSSNN